MCSQTLAVASSSSFLTVTITGPDEELMKAGDTDPSIPSVLSAINYDMYRPCPLENHISTTHYNRGYMFRQNSFRMTRGGDITWWEPVSTASDKMTYACDGGLGTPATVDCLQLQWQHPGSTDTITVTPGTGQVYSHRKPPQRDAPSSTPAVSHPKN